MNLIKTIFLFDHKTFKRVLIIILLSFFPFLIFAQSNPFKQENPSNMVNLFTGDFNYSIPLLEIPLPGGSYPITINYQSGIKLNQESSWVGLGWQINAGGAIERELVNYPDDSKGEFNIIEVEGDEEDKKKIVTYNISESGKTSYSTLENNSTKLNCIYGFLYLSDLPHYSDIGYQDSFIPFINTNIDSYIMSLNSKIMGYHSITIEEDQIDNVSDVTQNNSAEKTYKNLYPLHLSRDKYVLKGALTGVIEPVRFDNLSVSMSYPFSNNFNLNQSPGLRRHSKYKVTDSQSEKVQFRMKGEVSNSYDHHIGENNLIYAIPVPSHVEEPKWCSLLSSRLINNLVTSSSISQPSQLNEPEESRYGFNSSTRELTQATYIRWFSNEEFNNGFASSSGLMYHDTIYVNDSILEDHSIGGFMITDATGVTYHYTIPVYGKNRVATNISNNKTNKVSMLDPIVEKWLLTGITGPDFIDNNINGVIDKEDAGYWVKFGYDKYNSNYRWRFPYLGLGIHQDMTDNEVVQYFIQGDKEIYHLDYVQTSSHIALFLKNEREDLRSYYEVAVIDGLPGYQSSLKLSEVVLISNKDFEIIVNETGNNFKFNNIDDAVNELLKVKQLRRVLFNTDYSLCKNTPNSFSNDAIAYVPGHGTGGKLTLKSIEVFGSNNKKLAPSTEFSYGFNPDFNKYKFDSWGSFKNSINTQLANADGVAWNLNKIKNSTGAEINIEYERDDYIKVNGHTNITKEDHNLVINGVDYNFSHNDNEIYEDSGKNLENIIFPGDEIIVSCSFNINSSDTCNAAAYISEMNSLYVTSVSSDKIFCSPSLKSVFNEIKNNHNLSCDYNTIGINDFVLNSQLNNGDIVTKMGERGTYNH